MKPIKVKLREFMKELKYSHKKYTRINRHCGFQDFICCECKKCGKTWVE